MAAKSLDWMIADDILVGIMRLEILLFLLIMIGETF